MCNDEDLLFHSSTKPESGLPLQSLAEHKNSINLKTSSTALTGYGKWNNIEDVLGFNFFDDIVAVRSRNVLKAIDAMTLGQQPSCSPMVHKVSGELEAQPIVVAVEALTIDVIAY